MVGVQVMQPVVRRGRVAADADGNGLPRQPVGCMIAVKKDYTGSDTACYSYLNCISSSRRAIVSLVIRAIIMVGINQHVTLFGAPT